MMLMMVVVAAVVAYSGSGGEDGTTTAPRDSFERPRRDDAPPSLEDHRHHRHREVRNAEADRGGRTIAAVDDVDTR